MMCVKVLFFAALAERVGVRELNLELNLQATVFDALEELVGRYPALGDARDSLATAVNLEYVDAERLLVDGDELALIPPVSGG